MRSKTSSARAVGAGGPDATRASPAGLPRAVRVRLRSHLRPNGPVASGDAHVPFPLGG
jgi:hypothetical protein